MVMVPDDAKLVLDPVDEYTHTPEPVANYNESSYFNFFDLASGLGGWMRIGNRPNEGRAEMTCCLYLPDGRVGFMFARPEISDNSALAAGGMAFDVVEPFARHRVRYVGQVLLMDNPKAMANPSEAFKRYPKRPAEVHLDFVGASPMHGGEIVNLDGSPYQLNPERAVYRGHLEQNMLVHGRLTVAGESWDIDGTGYRDKSWGPRYWQNFYWYKWLPVTFDDGFGVLLSIKGRPGDADHVSGNVLRDGVLEPVVDGRIDTRWGDDSYPISLTAHVRTTERDYTIRGEVLSLVPLRHRSARNPEDLSSYTRITEAMTRFTCEGRTTLGMSEYLDLVKDGVPVSMAAADR